MFLLKMKNIKMSFTTMLTGCTVGLQLLNGSRTIGEKSGNEVEWYYTLWFKKRANFGGL